MGPAASVASTPWGSRAKTTLFARLLTVVARVSFDASLKALNVLSNEANGDTRMYRPDSAAWTRLARRPIRQFKNSAGVRSTPPKGCESPIF